MKKVFLLVLLAIFAIAAYSQTDSTKVKKKKKKIDWVSVHGTVADSFTKMGILDVKTILMKEDSTVIRSSLRYWVSLEGRTEIWTNSMRRYALLTVSYRFSQKPKKETGGLD